MTLDKFALIRRIAVTVVGTASGTVQVQRGGVWANAGRLRSDCTKVTVGCASVTGVRLVSDRGPAPVVNEIIVGPAK